ncbi:MAG: hypothetical protein C0522_07695 [Rhodocyclaceae bacterium]|jgi:hypothetical protein|nr:hypothetical protein [Rhodocyclaceae bacterium]
MAAAKMPPAMADAVARMISAMSPSAMSPSAVSSTTVPAVCNHYEADQAQRYENGQPKWVPGKITM